MLLVLCLLQSEQNQACVSTAIFVWWTDWLKTRRFKNMDIGLRIVSLYDTLKDHLLSITSV